MSWGRAYQMLANVWRTAAWLVVYRRVPQPFVVLRFTTRYEAIAMPPRHLRRRRPAHAVGRSDLARRSVATGHRSPWRNEHHEGRFTRALRHNPEVSTPVRSRSREDLELAQPLPHDSR